jgi:hypothetical protein
MIALSRLYSVQKSKLLFSLFITVSNKQALGRNKVIAWRQIYLKKMRRRQRTSRKRSVLFVRDFMADICVHSLQGKTLQCIFQLICNPFTINTV